MTITIDAMGQACPLPVVRAKKALDSMEEGTLEVLVDNETAVTNLTNLAKKKKCAVSSETLGEKQFVVRLMKGEVSAEDAAAAAAEQENAQGAVVVISSDVMGYGDDKLGATLMKGFVFALTQQDVLPSAVLMYNSGVKLACEGSEALKDLQALEEAGTTILSCGTCLQNFELTEKLAVGQPTNMYVIVETQMGASKILRP